MKSRIVITRETLWGHRFWMVQWRGYLGMGSWLITALLRGWWRCKCMAWDRLVIHEKRGC